MFLNYFKDGKNHTIVDSWTRNFNIVAIILFGILLVFWPIVYFKFSNDPNDPWYGEDHRLAHTIMWVLWIIGFLVFLSLLPDIIDIWQESNFRCKYGSLQLYIATH